jgi:hypothetical protein
MPTARAVINWERDILHTTHIFSERAFYSSWSHPDVPLLVFSESGPHASPVQYHGGPVGSGLPVELLYWGDWWNTPAGADRRALINTRTHALLDSNYFAEMQQYGVERPHWRGAMIVTRPGPPASFNSNDDIDAVRDLIDDLIDDDVFPDPDDEKIAFVVFMPSGFTQTINANGSHTKDYNYEFPWDKDWYWVAWVRSFGDIAGEDVEDTIRTMSHELVEMLSDPETDAWYADNPEKGEIGDLGVSSGGTKQTAWVNGAHVQAYWSNRHNATVIPIDRDYRARVLGSIGLEHREVVTGNFRPDPRDSRLCDLLPQCCIDNREYTYSLTKRDEVVRLSVETERYRQPQIVWMVEGTEIKGNVDLSLDVIAETYVGRRAQFGAQKVTVHCLLTNNELTLRTEGTEANFDIAVTCTVTDGSIVGKLKTNVIASPAVTVGFVGVELTVDPEYERQRTACEQAATKMFKDLGKHQAVRKPKIGDPVELGPAVLASVPAYARLHEYDRARRVVDLARMAQAVLPKATAKLLTASLVADVPVLQAAMAARSDIRKAKTKT